MTGTRTEKKVNLAKDTIPRWMTMARLCRAFNAVFGLFPGTQEAEMAPLKPSPVIYRQILEVESAEDFFRMLLISTFCWRLFWPSPSGLVVPSAFACPMN